MWAPILDVASLVNQCDISTFDFVLTAHYLNGATRQKTSAIIIIYVKLNAHRWWEGRTYLRPPGAQADGPKKPNTITRLDATYLTGHLTCRNAGSSQFNLWYARLAAASKSGKSLSGWGGSTSLLDTHPVILIPTGRVARQSAGTQLGTWSAWPLGRYNPPVNRGAEREGFGLTIHGEIVKCLKEKLGTVTRGSGLADQDISPILLISLP